MSHNFFSHSAACWVMIKSGGVTLLEKDLFLTIMTDF